MQMCHLSLNRGTQTLYIKSLCKVVLALFCSVHLGSVEKVLILPELHRAFVSTNVRWIVLHEYESWCLNVVSCSCIMFPLSERSNPFFISMKTKLSPSCLLPFLYTSWRLPVAKYQWCVCRWQTVSAPETCWQLPGVWNWVGSGSSWLHTAVQRREDHRKAGHQKRSSFLFFFFLFVLFVKLKTYSNVCVPAGETGRSNKAIWMWCLLWLRWKVSWAPTCRGCSSPFQ